MAKCAICNKELKATQKKYCSRWCSMYSINSKRKQNAIQKEQCFRCRLIGRGLTIILIALVLIHILVGCSHSGASTTKVYGIHLQLPIPEFPISLNIGYVQSTRTYLRQNSQATVQNYMATNVGAQASKLGATAQGKIGTQIKLKTGAQANGYVRDIVHDTKSKQQTDAIQHIFK